MVSTLLFANCYFSTKNAHFVKLLQKYDLDLSIKTRGTIGPLMYVFLLKLHFWGVIHSSVIFTAKYSLKPVAMRLLTVNSSFIDLPFPARQRVNFAKLPITCSSYCSFWRIYRSMRWTNYVKKNQRCAWCTFIRTIYVGCVICAFV